MKAKFFAVVLVVLLIASFCIPDMTYAAVTVDTIGTQFGVKVATYPVGTTARSFRFKGRNSTADSTATLADSGAVAGDSSSHFMQINIAAAAAGQIDSVLLIFPRGWVLSDSGTAKLDTLYTRSEGFTDNQVKGWKVKRGTANVLGGLGNDTLLLVYSNDTDQNGVATTAGTIFIGLRGIINDTSLYNGTSSRQIDTTFAPAGGVLPIGYIANGLSTVQTSGYVDTIAVNTVQRNLARRTDSDKILAYLRPANKNKLVFADSSGVLAATDTAGTPLGRTRYLASGTVGTFKVVVADKFGNIRFRDSSTAITLAAYGSTGLNPPSGNGRLRNPNTGTLSTELQTTHLGITGSVFSNVGYTRTGSGIFLKATATGATEGTTSEVTINQTRAQTVTFLTTESTPHSSPDTMTVGSTKTFEITVTDSFSNAAASDTLLIRNALGGTMFSTAPYYFHGGGAVGTFATTTASSNPDSGLLNSSGKFQFSYTTAGAVGTDTLIVRPYNILNGDTLKALVSRYVISIAAGSVAQVAISPITTNLEVVTANIKSSRRYTNKAEVHPDTLTFQGAVVAGDTVNVFVVLKDANGNVRNFTTSDIAQVAFNSNRKGTVLSGSTLDTVTIGTTSFVVGKFFYKAKATIDKDSIRATYSGSINSSYTIFQTVGGRPYSAVLIAPNKYAGTTSVAADTFPVADSLLVMGYVLDQNGNYADSGSVATDAAVGAVAWSKVSGGGGFRGKFPNSAADSTSLSTGTDNKKSNLGLAWAMLGDTLELFGVADGKYNFVADSTIGSGAYAVRKMYIQAKVFSDSVAGEQIVVKASYGTRELDQIRLYKQPKAVARVDMTVGRTTTYATTQLDTTVTSGQTIYFFSKYMDTYYNVITPDTADNTTTKSITWPKTALDMPNSTFDRAYVQDKQFLKTGPTWNFGAIDSVHFLSRGADSLGVSGFRYTDTTIVTSGTPHVRVSYKTKGTNGGYDWILSKFGNDSTSTTAVRDSIRLKTTLPVALSAFKIAVSKASAALGLVATTGDSSLVAGQPMYVRLIPQDANGNDIYTYQYRYLKLAIDGFTHTDTIKQTMEKKFGRYGIFWKGNDATTLRDSTLGAAYGQIRTVDADCTFSDNTEDFIFFTSHVDAALKVKVWSVAKDTSQHDTISATMTGNIVVRNAPIDTVVLSANARTNLGFWQDTPFDLTIALKDSFMNAVLDTGYIVTITANQAGVDGIENPVVVTNSNDIPIKLDRQMNDLMFWASLTNDVYGGTPKDAAGASKTVRGSLGNDGSAGVDIGAATVGAPATLRGQDFPGDAGGYIMLTFPPSANHPNLGTAVSSNLPIDYYMVYRSSTSSAADAVQWSVIVASPLPTGIDTIRAVIDVRGATSTLGYYWVAAVKGTLPPGVIGANLSKAAGIEIPENALMSVRVNEEMNLSAAAANESYAVVSADGNSVVSNLSDRVSARALDNSLPRGIFTPGGTVVTLSDVMIIAGYFGDDENFDSAFDVVDDGVIDLRDIIWQIFRLGTTPKNGDEDGALINDGINQSASLNVESLSSSDDVFNLQVSLKSTEEVAGYRFTVVYNPEHYEFIKANQGGFMTSEDGSAIFQVNDEVDGQVIVVALYTGSKYEAAKGDGILADMEFAWMGDEMSEIKVQDIQLIDASALINELDGVMVERPVALPNEFALGQNYPNPFNPETTIKFSIPEASNVKLVIYNILGQKVRELVSENMKPGFKRIVWDGTNDIGVKVASGIYIYQIRASNFVDQKKMVFMK